MSSSSRSIEKSPSRWLRAAGVAIGAAVVLFTPSPAAAIERQHHLGLGPAFGMLVIDGKSTTSSGFGGGLHYAYGLTDQFNLTAEASSVIVALDQNQDFPYSPRNRPAVVNHAVAGVNYVIDILRWVPYIGLHAGAYHLTGGTMNDALILPGAAVALGLDYQLSRLFAVGLAGRQHFMFTKLDTYPSYTTVLLRFEIMWGY